MRQSHKINRRVPFLRWLLIAVGLVSLVNLLYSAWHQDWTYDEPYHLNWSLRLLETRETERTSNSHYGSTTPVTLLNAVPFRFALEHNWGDPLPKFLARLPTIGWWLGLVITTLFFARHYAGEPAASIAAMLVALDPNLAAHGCLVTVDVAYACMTLLCLWAFLKLYETPGYYRAAVAGVALGLAFCTKFTAFLLVPLCLVALAAGVWKRKLGGRAILRGLGLTALIGVSATLCICAGYLFSDIGVPFSAITPSSSMMQRVLAVSPGFWLPLPKAFLSGFELMMALEQTTTWNVVLLGNYYSSGIWYYFFVVWLVKTPLAMLAVETAGVGSGLMRGALFRVFWSIFLLVSLVGFLAFFSFYFRMQVGLRYVLMCLPLGYLLAAPELGRWAQSRARGAILVGAVVALVLLEMGGYFGNQLSFTNLVILPKKSAYRWIADSNVDWGQNYRRNWKILEAHQVIDRFMPLHILPGVNVFTLNTVAGVWWNHEQHRWVRENLEPKRHLNHTFLWYEVDETAFERFLNEERRHTPPDDPGMCRASLGMRSLAAEGSLRLSEGGELVLVVGCLEVREQLDLEIIAERGDLIVGKFPTGGRCDGERIDEKKRAWFRLEPGLYPLCAKSTGPFEGAWRVHRGSAGFSQF